MFYESIIYQVLFCLDMGSSMSGRGEEGTASKAKIAERMINALVNIDLPEDEKESIGICVMASDDRCRILKDWIPLSMFTGDISVDAGGKGSLGNAITAAIDIMESRHRYLIKTELYGLQAFYQIYVYTDGFGTEGLGEAIKKAEEYLSSHPSVNLSEILIPPAKDLSGFKDFGSRITVLEASDCVNGVPRAFRNLNDSFLLY